MDEATLAVAGWNGTDMVPGRADDCDAVVQRADRPDGRGLRPAHDRVRSPTRNDRSESSSYALERQARNVVVRRAAAGWREWDLGAAHSRWGATRSAGAL